jgi:deoxycytidylate deaminase
LTEYHHRDTILHSYSWEFLYAESGDSVRQVAAILMFPNGKMFFGVNGLQGLCSRTGQIADYVWKKNRPLGRILATHAEAEAIRQAVLAGVEDFSESTLVCTLEPCGRCRELIEAAGIKEVFYAEQYVPST